MEPYWPGLFAKALEGISVKDLITNVGSGVGAGPATGGGNFKWKWMAKSQIGIQLYVEQFYKFCLWIFWREKEEVGHSYFYEELREHSIVTWTGSKRMYGAGYVAWMGHGGGVHIEYVGLEVMI